MLEYVYNAEIRVPAVLKNAAGYPVANLLYGQVSCSVIKADGTKASITLASASWDHVSQGAYVGQGYYNVLIGASYTDQLGVFQYCVKSDDSLPYFGVVKLVSGDSTAIVTLVTDTSSSVITAVNVVSASVQVVSASVQVVSASVLQLSNKVGTPASTIAGDISTIGGQLGSIATNASNAANYSQAAATSAGTAATNSSTAAINTTTIISNQSSADSKLGSPKSGSISADIKDIRDNLSGGGGGGGSTDLGPVLDVLGTPIRSISEDIKQVGKIVQDVQKKVT